MKAYLYEIFHRCNSLTDWTPDKCTLALSSTQKVEGAYSIKMTSDANQFASMSYNKTVDWSRFKEIIFSVYHPGWTDEIGHIGLFTDIDNYKYWEFSFAASWTEIVIDFNSAPSASEGTLDLSNITYIEVFESNLEDPGEDYYFDYFHGRSIDITSDIIHPLSFIECPIRDYHRAEFMARGTWQPYKNDTIEIYDYLTSNGSTVADSVIFQGSIIDYELTQPRKIWCDSRAKNDLDEFRPSGDYNGDLDSNHIKTLIAECSYITEGTIDATVGNTDNTFKGDKTFRTILNDWADKHYKHWYLSPTGALTFNDANIDSGVILFYHKATYNFKDDAIGGNPAGWVLDEFGGTVNIIASFDGHKKVVELDYIDGEIHMLNTFASVQTDGTIEGHIAVNNIGSVASYIIIYEGETVIIQLRFFEGDLGEYSGGAWNSIKDDWMVINTLYDIKIVCDDTANTYDIYINGVLEGNNKPYRNNSTAGIQSIKFMVGNPMKFYVDAVGYSWDTDYTVGDNLKGQLFQCWNVKPKKHVDAINWVKLLGAIVAGTQISAESKDQPSIDQLGPKLYKDTYALVKVVAQLQIAADNLRTREQLLPLAINLWSYEANRGLIQCGECVWVAWDRANPNISPRQVIINKIRYRFLSGHTDLQTTDGIAWKKDKAKALPQELSLLLQQ